MAAADTAKLVASLTLDAKGFTSGVKKAEGSLGHLEGTIGNIGRKAGAGLESLTKNVALLGAAAAGGIAVAVHGGLKDLATLETAVTSVDGAIKQLGLTGQVTGQQVADWANDIERDIGAAFDDKDITAAAATLIRFGKVTPKNLKQALVVMTDLAAKTGDVDSAATLLAKALADPAKAAGKLAKSGVILTKAQQETIKAMVEQNDIAGAQQVILDELAKTTGGAALASQGKYARSIAVLNDVAEDARKALAEGFFPVIEKVSAMLSKGLADPKFVNALRDFGTTLAGGLDDLISVAQKLPWDTIGNSLKLAGTGAKAVLDAFVALPPWVQTAVLTGWGLNKLTGGALGGIVSELGKGLIKGVLGMNAGVVNIKAGVVNGAGGGAPGAGAAGGLTAAAAGALGIGVVILGVTQAAAATLTGTVIGGVSGDPNKGKIAESVQTNLGGGPVNIFGPFQRIVDALSGDLRSPLEKAGDNSEKLVGKMGELVAGQQGLSQDERDQKSTLDKVHNAIVQTTATNKTNHAAAQTAAFAIRDKLAPLTPMKAGIDAVKTAVAATQAAAHQAGVDTAAAIRDKDLSVANYNSVTVNNRVSVQETIKTQTTFKQFNKFIS